MKKRIAMRVASLALCVVFTATVFGAPKAKAVAAETAIGVAVVAAYFAATGLALSASAGSTGELVTTGVGKIVTDFCAAVDHAGQTATDFYATLVANTNIRPDGALALSAAAVVAIGELVEWYVGENGLEVEGDTAVAVPGTSDIYSFEGHELPKLPSYSVNSFPYAVLITSNSKFYYLLVASKPFSVGSDGSMHVSSKCSFEQYFFNKSGGTAWSFNSSGSKDVSESIILPFWANHEVLSHDGSVFLVADSVYGKQFEVTRSPEFVQLDSDFTPESQKQMVIDLGFAPGITLDEAVELVPERIAVGELAPTYEITTEQAGEGEGTEQPDDSLVYVPWFERIQTSIGNLGSSIVDGILDGVQGLFVPSEAYMEALPAQITDTFDERTGFLTYPFSLLPDFVDRLSAPSDDWILKWPQIAEPFTGTILFQQGSWNVTAFVQANAQIKRLYDLWRLIAKAIMSFGFIGLCYNKYRSVVGDRYGEG